MQRGFRQLFVAFLVLFIGISSGVYAQDPVKMLENVTNRMIRQLEADQSVLKQKPEHIYDIVDSILVPYADFEEMSRWVAGRQAWARASAPEQKAFAQALQALVIQTYAVSLNQYRNQTVEYRKPRSEASASQIQVESIIKEPGRDPLHVAYRLKKSPQGWKVYDILIEGVSLIRGFQNQFAETIRKQGLSAATESITQHHLSQRTHASR